MDAWIESEGRTWRWIPKVSWNYEVEWPWELLSKFGNPWADFASFGGKALGKKSHQFASESPWNDQFFKQGSFAIPRVFQKQTNSDQDRFETRKTDFDRFGTRDHVAPSLAPAQALFCTRRAAPPGSKNRKKCRKLFLYILNILSMERELWGIFIYEKITISSNLTRKEWNLGNWLCAKSPQFSELNRNSCTIWPAVIKEACGDFLNGEVASIAS